MTLDELELAIVTRLGHLDITGYDLVLANETVSLLPAGTIKLDASRLGYLNLGKACKQGE